MDFSYDITLIANIFVSIFDLDQSNVNRALLSMVVMESSRQPCKIPLQEMISILKPNEIVHSN